MSISIFSRDQSDNDFAWRRAASVYLWPQNLAAAVWWALLVWHPPTRARFVFPAAPDATLMAFGAPDALLFIGAGLVAACQLAQQRPHTRDWLLLHSGGACYAALYCLHAWILEPRAWLNALAMAPCLVVLPLLCWRICWKTTR